ncbi:4'-phosphopantetheinyl transferase domain-containing protein [Toxoplasma gondii TgCatPRC2]|uniref:4'-phosphopantetheinyl transferase domain-containing protein n=1 Tax=Toxoplasma gondii TgCatPRC2 TaxID=1130821 RepID=A0A151HAY5_TOXGO|nr:4'-phosphopantetheinyl transferase domain-containing protein [Toxoplasma gondii TgCatPRC2]
MGTTSRRAGFSGSAPLEAEQAWSWKERRKPHPVLSKSNFVTSVSLPSSSLLHSPSSSSSDSLSPSSSSSSPSSSSSSSPSSSSSSPSCSSSSPSCLLFRSSSPPSPRQVPSSLVFLVASSSSVSSASSPPPAAGVSRSLASRVRPTCVGCRSFPFRWPNSAAGSLARRRASPLLFCLFLRFSLSVSFALSLLRWLASLCCSLCFFSVLSVRLRFRRGFASVEEDGRRAVHAREPSRLHVRAVPGSTGRMRRVSCLLKTVSGYLCLSLCLCFPPTFAPASAASLRERSLHPFSSLSPSCFSSTAYRSSFSVVSAPLPIPASSLRRCPPTKRRHSPLAFQELRLAVPRLASPVVQRISSLSLSLLSSMPSSASRASGASWFPSRQRILRDNCRPRSLVPFSAAAFLSSSSVASPSSAPTQVHSATFSPFPEGSQQRSDPVGVPRPSSPHRVFGQGDRGEAAEESAEGSAEDDPLAEVDAYLDSLEREETRRIRGRPRRRKAGKDCLVRADTPASSLEENAFFSFSSAQEASASAADVDSPSASCDGSSSEQTGDPSSRHAREGAATASSRRAATRASAGDEGLVSRRPEELIGDAAAWGEVTVDRDEELPSPLDEGLLARQASAVLELLGLRAFSVSVHFLDAEKMTQLNRSKRNTNAPTDVLAFPSRSPTVYRRLRSFLTQLSLPRQSETGESGDAATPAKETSEDWEASSTLTPLRSPADLSLGEVFFCSSAIQDAIDADRREAEILAESGRPCVHLGSGIKDLLKPRLSVPERLPLLFIHAVLHLLGFDHEEEGDAREMEAVEAALFARFLRQAQPRGLLQGGGPAAPHFLLGTGLDVCSISRMQRFLLRQLRPDLERASKSSFVEARTEKKNAASPKPMSSFGQTDETETRPLEKQVKDGKNKETASPGEAPVSASEVRVSQERPIGDPVGCISTRRLKRALDRILTPLEILDFQRRFGGLCELLDASWPGPKSASSVQEEGRNLRKRARKAFEGEEAKKAAATEPRRGTVAERERDREREETRALQRECREKNSENMGKENDADLSRTLRRASAFLAKRFAAKEALVKAMGGAGLRHLSSQGIRMRDIEIFQGLNGQPLVRLLGEALALQQQKRISNLFVSITDEGDIAMASATAVGT